MKQKIPKLVPGQRTEARRVISVTTVKCLIVVDGWILLGHETGDRYPGGKGLGWSLPGGAVEDIETAEMIRQHIEKLIIGGQNFGQNGDPFEIKETDPKRLGLIREVLEEVGLLVELEDEPVLTEKSRDGIHAVCVYRAKSFRGQLMLSEDGFREVDAAGWFRPEALPSTKESFRSGWSLYASEEQRIKKICPQNERYLTVWEETTVTDQELHMLVRDENGPERRHGFGWTEDVDFAKRTIGVRDNESLKLCGITGKIFVSQDGVPDAPRAVAIHGDRLSLSHESNCSFFHLQRLSHSVAVIEIGAADQGSRAVTYHNIMMPEGLGSVDPSFQAMVSEVWLAHDVTNADSERHSPASPEAVGNPIGKATNASAHRNGNNALTAANKAHLHALTDLDLELKIPEEVK